MATWATLPTLFMLLCVFASKRQRDSQLEKDLEGGCRRGDDQGSGYGKQGIDGDDWSIINWNLREITTLAHEKAVEFVTLTPSIVLSTPRRVC